MLSERMRFGPGNQVNGSGVPIPIEKTDQNTPWNDFYFVQANGDPTVLTAAVPTAGNTRIISVASVANISVGDWIGLFSGASGEERYYWASVISISGLNLTMQTLIDYPFPAGSTVLSTSKNMAVNGSVTPQIFGIQAGGISGDLAIDITRIMMACLTTSAVDLGRFGDISGGLAYGIYLRVKENGVYRNKMIARKNYDLAKFAYDWTPFAATNPAFGQNGFVWRFSLNGDDKHGAVSRIKGGNVGSLQWVIQDDLRTITNLESIGANHEIN